MAEHSTNSTALRGLLVRAEIAGLHHCYALSIDQFELEALMELWTEDAVFDEREVGLLLSEGREAIRQFFADDFEVRVASAHLMVNQLVQLTSDTEATGSVCALVEADLRSGEKVHANLLYRDRYRLVDGRWRYRERSVHALTEPQLGDITTQLAALGEGSR